MTWDMSNTDIVYYGILLKLSFLASWNSIDFAEIFKSLKFSFQVCFEGILVVGHVRCGVVLILLIRISILYVIFCVHSCHRVVSLLHTVDNCI